MIPGIRQMIVVVGVVGETTGCWKLPQAGDVWTVGVYVFGTLMGWEKKADIEYLCGWISSIKSEDVNIVNFNLDKKIRWWSEIASLFTSRIGWIIRISPSHEPKSLPSASFTYFLHLLDVLSLKYVVGSSAIYIYTILTRIFDDWRDERDVMRFSSLSSSLKSWVVDNRGC